MSEIEFIFPAQQGEDDQLCHGLVTLTEAIHQIDPDIVSHGFLGGMFGYGARFENDVFTMRPYYWGDCDCGADERSESWFEANPHSKGCYQTKLRCEEIAAGVHYTQETRMPYKKRRALQEGIYKRLCREFGVTYPSGCAVHCTCGRDERSKVADIWHKPTCALELPNFLYKPNGFEVRWYKYIGRGNETVGDAGDLAAMFATCLASLPNRADANNKSPHNKGERAA